MDRTRTRTRYFTPSEVAAHNTTSDLWVSFLGKVFDLSPLVACFQGDPLLLPITECAGSDISSWFDPRTRDIRRFVDPQTNCIRYYTPRGRFIHTPPSGPRSDWDNDVGEPWWRNLQYQVGLLSEKTRWIRIVNTLTSQEQLQEVCSEETMEEILQRYLCYNSHARSYTWKFDGAILDMSATLMENGVPDDDQELDQLGLDRDTFIPAVLLHFNDDLTEG
ncbi:cytochrome b5 domain-containing protein 1 [Nothobranchius furzeri]|uniref:cytochrome b5 domain-containing protein 1 n=1 Tax=Nothobranchius furzeri TaxID=105023 RepID=UPI00077D1149|nr:cytochrome b5 domain-containing protein 1 [Nothobranchius furzeri]XP_054594545.1 cytochrome b5 domain-containing protein 1 [Nothobranchius furzeri]